MKLWFIRYDWVELVGSWYHWIRLLLTVSNLCCFCIDFKHYIQSVESVSLNEKSCCFQTRSSFKKWFAFQLEKKNAIHDMKVVVFVKTVKIDCDYYFQSLFRFTIWYLLVLVVFFPQFFTPFLSMFILPNKTKHWCWY